MKRTIQQLGRFLAVLSVVVFLFGKSVHVYQECDCCNADSTLSSDSEGSSKTDDLHQTCPFGCCHVEEPDQEEQNPAPKHEEHLCPVCSLLAQAPENVCLISLPEVSDFVSETLNFVSDDAVATDVQAAASRGPPAA